jgi:CRISPR-associated protein (TIGR03986 family)
MPGKPDKQHRIRVRTRDGKPRDTKELNKLKSSQLGMPHLDIVGTGVPNEFIICAGRDTHIEPVRTKLGAAGLDEIEGGETAITATAAAIPARQHQGSGGSRQQRAGQSPREGAGRPQQGRQAHPVNHAQPLPGKPYGFVALLQELTTAPPIWHDGTSSQGRLSGEIRFEFETLTPLLVGGQRQTLSESEDECSVPLRKVSRNECASVVQTVARATYPDATDSDDQRRQQKQQKVEAERRKYIQRVQDHIVDVQIQHAGWSIDSKSVLCPLRAPWGKRPVIIPGDSLKGLLRHELGALLGAPMERVAERSYSYRPNALFPNQPNPRLIARIARVPRDGVEMKALDDNCQVRMPTKLELMPMNLRYDKNRNQSANFYRFDDGNGAPYRGGQGAGERLNSKRNLHTRLTANPSQPTESATLSQAVQDGYLATLRHLVDLDHGHFSERHPDVPKTVTGDAARTRILKAATDEVFQPGDLIWVEWDTEKKCIVSVGWHYYYRWAYTDSVRKDADAPRLERRGLFPLDEEREQDADGAPKELSAVRRLLGYTGDNEGSAGIGEGDHAQLMGRVFVNAGLEVVGESDVDDDRFLNPTFLRELGMPRPSAVEHYLKQPYHPQSRPSDRATLVTYGDAAGYDAPGELAGRKFYLDRKDAYSGRPWEDDSPANRQNDRSTLALEASKPGRKFRFTVRFRDLDAAELAAILIALCPDQFQRLLGGTHADGYCSKLGYARPLGWGSIRIEARQLLLLDEAGEAPTLKLETDLAAWVTKNHQKTATQDEWLAIHRRRHPGAADYPRKDGQIYTFHTGLRAEHSRNRRYRT